MAEPSGKKKKSRKEKLAEQRDFDRKLGLNKGVGGVDLSKVADRHMDDKRFERELAFKQSMEPGGVASGSGSSGAGGNAGPGAGEGGAVSSAVCCNLSARYAHAHLSLT